MYTAIGIAAVLVLILALILMVGSSRQKIGALKVESENDVKQDEREARAKRIESQPPPVTADDVADAWAGMRDVPEQGSHKQR